MDRKHFFFLFWHGWAKRKSNHQREWRGIEHWSGLVLYRRFVPIDYRDALTMGTQNATKHLHRTTIINVQTEFSRTQCLVASETATISFLIVNLFLPQVDGCLINRWDQHLKIRATHKSFASRNTERVMTRYNVFQWYVEHNNNNNNKTHDKVIVSFSCWSLRSLRRLGDKRLRYGSYEFIGEASRTGIDSRYRIGVFFCVCRVCNSYIQIFIWNRHHLNYDLCTNECK